MHLVKVDENLRTDVIFDAPHGALSISQSLKTTGLLKDIKLGILDSNIIKIGIHLLWFSCKDICDDNFYTDVNCLEFHFQVRKFSTSLKFDQVSYYDGLRNFERRIG